MNIKNILISVVWLCIIAAPALSQTTDNLVFIHHSCGANWLSSGLHSALLAKSYIDERNDITYGTVLSPDAGRPSSLGSVPGDRTDMNHWILWFNDYLTGVKNHDCEDGINKIIMYKSCYPISNIYNEGTEPGDPFSATRYTANYKAVYRHPNGPGNTYEHDTYTYYPLEDIFAANPDILFIAVTAPPRHYGTTDATNDAEAQRARDFNNWLKTDWLNSYNTANPGLNNVAVFDWFNILAYPADDVLHPNRLKEEYGGNNNNSHPNTTANNYSTDVFATDTENFIDTVWDLFNSTVPVELSAFQAFNANDGIELRWTTESEVTNLGWNIYRSENSESDYQLINHELVAGHGTTTQRHDYSFKDENIVSGCTYSYLLHSIDTNGDTETHGPVAITANVNHTKKTPEAFTLGNYPNPFNDRTIIRYSLPTSGKVSIDIYDTRGALVSSLVNEYQNAGSYEIPWTATGHSSGAYFCHISGAGLNRTVKLLYLR